MSTGKCWGVNEHTMLCSSSVSVVSQHNLQYSAYGRGQRNGDRRRPVAREAREGVCVLNRPVNDQNVLNDKLRKRDPLVASLVQIFRDSPQNIF